MKKIFNKKTYTFAIIGVLNTLINVGVLIFLVDTFSFNVVISNTIAFTMANIFSYFTNSFYTFKHNYSIEKYFKFLSSSIFLLIISNLVFIFIELIDAHYYIGILINITILPAFSYLIMQYYIFTEKNNA